MLAGAWLLVLSHFRGTGGFAAFGLERRNFMRITHTQVFNLEGAARGVRNPMNSWDKSDSRYADDGQYA